MIRFLLKTLISCCLFLIVIFTVYSYFNKDYDIKKKIFAADFQKTEQILISKLRKCYQFFKTQTFLSAQNADQANSGQARNSVDSKGKQPALGVEDNDIYKTGENINIPYILKEHAEDTAKLNNAVAAPTDIFSGTGTAHDGSNIGQTDSEKLTEPKNCSDKIVKNRKGLLLAENALNKSDYRVRFEEILNILIKLNDQWDSEDEK